MVARLSPTVGRVRWSQDWKIEAEVLQGIVGLGSAVKQLKACGTSKPYPTQSLKIRGIP